MTDLKTGASATVQLTLRVSVHDNWGSECTVAQIYKQAAESAIGAIHRVLRDPNSRINATIVGEPKVTAVFAEYDT